MINAFVALALCSAAVPAPSDSLCYVLLFGGQAEKYRPHTAHTWATFVKTTPAGLESFTISWLPVRLPVHPWKLIPEAGRNYGLHETLEIFNTGKQELGLWGPYEIQPAWYAEALLHKQFLDGGVRFNTLDRGPLLPGGRVRRPDISHCVHAVTRTHEPLRAASNPVFGYGELITRKVAASMTAVGLLIDPATTHDWLLAALAVDRYPFHRHRAGEPLRRVLH